MISMSLLVTSNMIAPVFKVNKFQFRDLIPNHLMELRGNWNRVRHQRVAKWVETFDRCYPILFQWKFSTHLLQRKQDRCLCEALLRGKDNWINKSFIRNLTLEQTYIRIWQPLCKNKKKHHQKYLAYNIIITWITHLMSGRMFEIKVLSECVPTASLHLSSQCCQSLSGNWAQNTLTSGP